MLFILSGYICSVIKHNLLRWDIIFIHAKVDLFLRDDVFCNLNSKFQPCCSIAFSALIFSNTVAYMSGTIFQSFCQMMPYSEFTDQAILIPQIIICFRYKPIRHIYRMFV